MSEPELPPFPTGAVVRIDEALAAHSPWRVGGTCDAFVVVHRPEALHDTLEAIKARSWNRTLIGAGSRTVFRDGGLAGAVVRLGTGFVGVTAEADGWWVGAATPLAMFADVAVRAGLSRFERCRFAPGTIGASVALGEGWAPWVTTVRHFSRGGERPARLADVAQRSSLLLTAVRVQADVDAPAPGPELPGSWYAPLDDEHPADLLRQGVLSDTRLRSVRIPAAAPELLVNLGGATARDLALLQKSVIERVHTNRGVMLQDRMRWMGRVS